ncbi:MAG: hypothetical protein AAF127_16475 [Pseudomonadota bacterium]
MQTVGGRGHVGNVATDGCAGVDLLPFFVFLCPTDREGQGGWCYMTADRYCGTIYVGVTGDLAARISQHRAETGSDFCVKYGVTRFV